MEAQNNPTLAGVKERDAAFMAKLAPQYDDLVTKDFSVYHNYHLVPYLRDLSRRMLGAKLLDVGCGTGVVSIAAMNLGFNVTGVDHTPEMLAVAKQKAGSGHATFQVAEIDALPFPDASFDVITCQRMLHHVPELKPALAETARVLRPGGFFYISDYCGDPNPLKRTLAQTKRRLVGKKSNVERLLGDQALQVDVSDAIVSEDEKPVSAPDLMAGILAAGLIIDDVLFLTHIGYRKFLNDQMRMALIHGLSFPWRRTHGEMIFIKGRK